METNLQQLYTQLLETFRNDTGSQLDTYREMLNTNHQNDLARQRQGQEIEMSLMNNQYNNMAALAREQAQDWLNNNSRLMSESSVYRSRESDQQYRQDKSMQQERLGSDQLMQKRQFGQEKEIIDRNEAVDTRRRNSDRLAAIDAYRRF